MNQLFSFGIGTGSTNGSGDWLEVFFARPLHAIDASTGKALLGALADAGLGQKKSDDAIVAVVDDEQLRSLADSLQTHGLETQSELAGSLIGSCRKNVVVLLFNDAAPASVPEAYLKLHLLSHRLVRPHGVSLQGIFASLPNLAWTNEGPVDLAELPQRQLEARRQGQWLQVRSVDKFPPMVDYVVPTGVRIADTARVRLGAFVGEGTTIMHEGFINFNAGTAGTSMIEGRISAGVFVGQGSDLGGGCSTMGTLSGGGDVVISVGEECLIGANAGTGIALGDRCTIEAGLYVTAGTKVALLDEHGELIEQVKARSLSGQSDLLFRRNSINGAVECKTNRSSIQLNEALHSNN